MTKASSNYAKYYAELRSVKGNQEKDVLHYLITPSCASAGNDTVGDSILRVSNKLSVHLWLTVQVWVE